MNAIVEKESPINIKELRYMGLYDGIFAIFLQRITDVRWHRYFAKQKGLIKANSIVVTSFKNSCYYNGRMEINHTDAVLGGSAILHEFGHFVFDKMLSTEDGDIIASLFKKEVAHFIEDEDYLIKLHQKYCPSIEEYKFCLTRKYCPVMITDGVGILKGAYSAGICHGYNYPIEFLATELFAEALETEVFGHQIPLVIYKEECPQTYSYIRKRIYETLTP